MNTPSTQELLRYNTSMEALNAYRQLANNMVIRINSLSQAQLSMKEYFEGYAENFNTDVNKIMESMLLHDQLKVGQRTIKHHIKIFSKNEQICASLRVIAIQLSVDGQIESMEPVIAKINESWQDLLGHLIEQGVFFNIRTLQEQKMNSNPFYGSIS